MSAWAEVEPGAWRRTWDSTVEWLAAAPSKVNADHVIARSLAPSGPAVGRASWYGEEDGAVGGLAVAHGARPWPAGRALFRQAADTLGASGAVPRVQSYRRRRAWGADGDSLDVDRALAGAWDTAWARTVREQRPEGTGAVVRLVIQAAASARTSAADYVWSAVTACAFADACETAGLRVEIVRVHLAEAVGKSATFTRSDLPLKAAAEPLDVDRVLRLTAHPGAFRTAGLRADGLTLPRKVRPDMGQPLAWYGRSSALCGPEDAGAVVAPEAGAVRDAADAAAWIRRELVRLGIEDPDERARSEAADAAERVRYAADLARWRAEGAAATEAERARVARLTPAERAAEERNAEAARQKADRDYKAWEKRSEAARKADTELPASLPGLGG